jgi:hypothetical protein
MISTLLVVFIVAATSLSPVIGSPAITSSIEKRVTIETQFYQHHTMTEIVTEISENEAAELKQCLTNLHEALMRGDHDEIEKFESILRETGILGESSVSSVPWFQGSCGVLDENISNRFCYVHAVGEGLMIFTLGVFTTVLALLGIVFPEIFYSIMFNVTHLRPFRILLPLGIMIFQNGSISTRGLSGHRSLTVGNESIPVVLVGFSGITINMIWGENPLLFVSGFSMIVKNYPPSDESK